MSRFRAKPIEMEPWTTAQDVYLIEHADLTIEQLQQQLPYTQDQIIQRKQALGLVRRQRQMCRYVHELDGSHAVKK